MKNLLLIVIKFYWFLIPKSKRRKCLFKTSCSNYVYKETKIKGLFQGFKALRFRVQNCNPNYSLMELDGEQVLITNKGIVIQERLINENILLRL